MKGSAMDSKYFVKFTKYNDTTLSKLINKSVKFSTVYEFNDFNELHFISAFRGVDPNDLKVHQKDDQEILNFINEYLQNPENRIKLHNHMCNSGIYCREFLSTHKEVFCNSPEFDLCENTGLIRISYENIAFSVVGILCLSSIEIFNDDSAQLMFAHYADNLKGIALIYHHTGSTKLTPINYKKLLRKERPAYASNIVLKWCKGDYKEMDNFLSKSNKWSYENEHRMFSQPGIKSASDVGLELKGIFYTPRFDPNALETLRKINTKFYDDELFLREIYPSSGAYHFNTYHENMNISLKSWLESYFEVSRNI